MCTKARYRERLIVVSTTLGKCLCFFLVLCGRILLLIEMLDGKQITDNSRQFLMSWKASREAQQTREKTRTDFNDGSGYQPTHGGKLKVTK